ncbi:hypothetical protein GGR57DRAFT_469174 [Xylariaceae sp. FL1272]|nr:hypothetical protein GGR57DRAFT_469174 [Xylariaceae sp. FL1272]
MSIRISLDKPPEFYTNLDIVSGRVILNLTRPESIGNIVVKLEGESQTALVIPPPGNRDDYNVSNEVVSENHKILYKVFQVYPDDGVALQLQPGQHEFKFNFKLPLNNICHDVKALLNAGAGVGVMNKGGIRTMDPTKQMLLLHLKSTLPPSITGFPRQAEVRYYIKVTIQRPSIFKENWRYSLGLKFLPIEPPRPKASTQEAFARRPFAFKPRTPLNPSRKSFFSKSSSSSPDPNVILPSFEISTRLPYPSILTCNEPVPLRIISKKLSVANEQIYLSALEVALIGHTHIRVNNLENVERSTWVVASALDISIPLGKANDPVGTEFEIPNTIWAGRRLPNTVSPSFRTCNLARRYELEIRLSLSWGKNGSLPQVITLPLKMSKIEIFSGIKPPTQLLQTATVQPTSSSTPFRATASTSSHRPSNANTNGNGLNAPRPPPRPGVGGAPSQPPRPADPLYPPQLGPGNVVGDDDAPPPSYDEAMAESLSGPQERPAYSGITAENSPSTMPGEKGR